MSGSRTSYFCSAELSCYGVPSGARSKWDSGSLKNPFRSKRSEAPGTGSLASGSGAAFERASSRWRLTGVDFPTILDDFVLRDFFAYLGMIMATFLTLMLVFTLFELLTDIMRNHISAWVVGDYLLNVCPYFIYNLTQYGVLLAVLVTFGLMERSNEVTAIKATGTSIYRIIVPVLVICSVMAGSLFFFDQFYLPHANKRQDALRNQIKGKPAQTYLRPDRKWIFGSTEIPHYSLSTQTATSSSLPSSNSIPAEPPSPSAFTPSFGDDPALHLRTRLVRKLNGVRSRAITSSMSPPFSNSANRPPTSKKK